MHPIIEIFIDGKLFAKRGWPVIPRRGDYVQFDEGQIQAQVQAVVFSDAGIELERIKGHVPTRPVVTLLCKAIDSVS